MLKMKKEEDFFYTKFAIVQNKVKNHLINFNFQLKILAKNYL